MGIKTFESEEFSKECYAKVVADTLAYGPKEFRDNAQALAWYAKSNEIFMIVDVRIELLLRCLYGIGCDKNDSKEMKDFLETMYDLIKALYGETFVEIFESFQKSRNGNQELSYDDKLLTLVRMYARQREHFLQY